MANKKLKILSGVDGFKLHNMAVEEFFLTAWGEFCGPYDSPYAVGFVFRPPPYYALRNHPHLFGSCVQTMLKLCSAYLISLHCRQAQMDRDSDVNYEIDLFHTTLGNSFFLKGFNIASLAPKL